MTEESTIRWKFTRGLNKFVFVLCLHLYLYLYLCLYLEDYQRLYALTTLYPKAGPAAENFYTCGF